MIGKGLTNVHDLKRVNVKQTPINGNDIEMSEMSALTDVRSVDNTTEDLQNLFRRTGVHASARK